VANRDRVATLAHHGARHLIATTAGMRQALAGTLLVLAALAPCAAQEHPRMSAGAIATDRANFRQCLDRLRGEASARRVSREVFDRETASLTPNMRLIGLQRGGQAEFERPLWDYLAAKVSAARITEGRTLLQRHAALFDRLERSFGVDRFVLTAIWAGESNFGRTMGDASILRSTATLACIGRRQEFYANEFVAALEIVARGDIPSARLRGSWAGAFGHMQFMPTTFRAHAVDADGDGRRDLIASIADGLGSAANKLKTSGWMSDANWGYEVVLPSGFDHRLGASDQRMPIAEWERLGVRRADGAVFPRGGDVANLLLPTGARGPAFLVTQNFHVLRLYNTSDAYAIGIGHLADRLRGGGPILRSWPRDVRSLSRAERMELQRRLTHMGFDTGGTEGRFGARTRDAVRNFQVRAGLLPDGFATEDVLVRLRRHGAGN
jgi:lytic murein transglycosylase